MPALTEMNPPVHPLILVSLAVLPWIVASQNPVQIQFVTAPVLVRSGSEADFTIQTASDVFTVTWTAPSGETLGLWVGDGNQAVVNPVAQYEGRITIGASQLKISNAQLRDAGNYSVRVVPSATTGLTANSLSAQLRVFDAVSGVSVSASSQAVEGRNFSMRCTWSQGTDTSVAWGKGDSNLSSDPRITITGGNLVINPVQRGDAGDYSCTVSNPVSAQTATNSLTVYYGPDTPQITKTPQAECVGNADAIVGQTVELSCTSDSLPPALFSWTEDGSPVANAQPDSGALSLQIFSTNQSGKYVCRARNSVTGGTSEQQTELVVGDTCLSGGAVAGIVIACFVAIILIIVIIIVLVRQRNVDRRVREAIGLQKTNQNNGPTTLDPLPNAQVTNGAVGNHPNPPLRNNLNTHTIPQNQQSNNTFHRNNNGNLATLTPNWVNDTNTRRHNGQINTNTLQHNGRINANAFQHNDGHSIDAFPYNGHPNTNSNPYNGPQNPNAFPQSGQPNPNILIQTGSSQPGALPTTIQVNLNTLPRTDHPNNTVQPSTVHVNLNAYPTETSRPDQSSQPHNDQQDANALQRNSDSNGNRRNLIQTGQSYYNPQWESGMTNRGHQQQIGPRESSGNNSRYPNDLTQTGYSNPTNQTDRGHRTANTQRSSEYQLDSQDSTLGTNTQIRQMPWDRLRGTPAYPNHQTESSDSSDSQSSESQRPRPHRTQPVSTNRHTQADSRTRERDTQRPNSLSAAQMHSQMDPNIQRQMVQQNTNSQPLATAQNQAAQRQPVSQTRNPQANGPSSQMNTTGHAVMSQGTTRAQSQPRTQAAPTHTVQTARLEQNRQDQRQRAPQSANTQLPSARPNPTPLNQAALQQPTGQNNTNPFANGAQQTHAALQRPGPQTRQAVSGGAPTQPAQPQTNKAGQRPPTPPPVLRPSEFRTLPRERLQRPNAAHPVPVRVRHAADLPHGHHAPNMHRHPGNVHVTAHRHMGNMHVPPHTHRPANAQRHPANARQHVHRGQPRR